MILIPLRKDQKVILIFKNDNLSSDSKIGRETQSQI